MQDSNEIQKVGYEKPVVTSYSESELLGAVDAWASTTYPYGGPCPY
jgi:hypothetical protein